MVDIPENLYALKKGDFLIYLENEGALVLDPTNPYEVVRYKTNEEKTVDKEGTGSGLFTHVIYKKLSGRLTYTGWSNKHYGDFLRGWPLGANAPKLPKKKKQGAGVQPGKPGQTLREELLERDGTQCWFCGQFMEEDDISVEHFLAKSIKGGNHRANLALAHKTCNSMAANKPLVEKITLRLELHKLSEQGEYEP